jgi:lipoprotein-releasing system permease protein
MNFRIILSISKTHLMSRKKQSIIAALGVTFGIGAYVIMMSFMTGLNGLLDGLILNRTPHVHLYNDTKPTIEQPILRNGKYKDYQTMVLSVKPQETKNQIHNAVPIMNLLEQKEEVQAVTTQVRAQASYLAGSIQISGSLIGVDVLAEDQYYNLGDYIVEGSVQSLALNENGILLGRGIAEKLSLEVGDLIPIGTITGEQFQLKIVGYYQSGLAEIDDIQSYVNLKTARRIIGVGTNYITDVNVKLFDIDNAPVMAKDLERVFGITATDIQTANAQFETGTAIRNLISYAVSITLLIVAGFGIYNILNMSIYEKMNDIAILKATGFSGKDVRSIFLSQAMIIGFLGGLIGILVGFIVSYMISRVPFETEALPTIKTYPVNFDPMFYVIGVVFALVATFFAGYLPSKKAQKIDPVDIIRGQ